MAGELLASLKDVNTHLSEVNAIADSIDDQLQIDAQRVIRSQLGGVFQPTTIATWVDPATTPPIIRRIAGMFIAAKWYASQYSEDSTTVPAYAQWLYQEAIAQLAAIRSGSITVEDSDGVILTGETATMNSNSFWPNDSTPGPYFTMDREFA